MDTNYQSNSFKSKEAEKEKKQIVKVANGSTG